MCLAGSPVGPMPGRLSPVARRDGSSKGTRIPACGMLRAATRTGWKYQAPVWPVGRGRGEFPVGCVVGSGSGDRRLEAGAVRPGRGCLSPTFGRRALSQASPRQEVLYVSQPAPSSDGGALGVPIERNSLHHIEHVEKFLSHGGVRLRNISLSALGNPPGLSGDREELRRRRDQPFGQGSASKIRTWTILGEPPGSLRLPYNLGVDAHVEA
jgi:hypothetical protein